MNKYILIAIQLLLVFQSYSQPNLNRTYVLTQNVNLQQCDAVGTPIAVHQNVFRGFEFKIDKILTNAIVIHFIRWSNSTVNNAAFFNPAAAAKTPSLYYILPLSEFSTAIEKYRKAPFALGIAIIPIKMRFGNNQIMHSEDKRYFSFESAVSLSFSIGTNIKLDKSKFTARNNIAILTGISLSSVPLDSFTTKGFVKSSSNNASITGHLGIVYQIDNFQVGIFTGLDFLAGEIGTKWKYKNAPWLGIGLGYSIFQSKKTTDTQ